MLVFYPIYEITKKHKLETNKPVVVKKSILPKVNKSNYLKLNPFNSTFWDRLPADKKFFDYVPNSSNIKYFTINIKGDDAGVLGIFNVPNNPSKSYFQVYLKPDYRGRGITRMLLTLIDRKYGLSRMITDPKHIRG